MNTHHKRKITQSLSQFVFLLWELLTCCHATFYTTQMYVLFLSQVQLPEKLPERCSASSSWYLKGQSPVICSLKHQSSQITFLSDTEFTASFSVPAFWREKTKICGMWALPRLLNGNHLHESGVGTQTEQTVRARCEITRVSTQVLSSHSVQRNVASTDYGMVCAGRAL